MAVNKEEGTRILQTILEALKHTDDGILINDWNEKIIYCNRSFVSGLGLDPEGNYTGKNLRDIVPPHLHSILDEFRAGMLSYGRYSKKLSADVDGDRKLTVHILSTLIRSVEPNIAVSVIRDVTEIEDARAKLEVRSKELALLNEIYSFSNIKQDLKEILISMMDRIRQHYEGITFAIYKMNEDGLTADLISSYGIGEKYIEIIKTIYTTSPIQQAILSKDRVIILDDELSEEMRKRSWIRDELGIAKTLAFNFRLRGNVVFFAYVGLPNDRLIGKDTIRFLNLARDQLNSLLERIYLLDELSKREAELKGLAAKLFTSVENERREIAMALHDETEQYIAASNMELDLLESRLPGECSVEVRELIESIRSKLNHISASAKKISSALRPAMLEDLGLTAAIQWFVDQFVSNNGIEVDFEVVGFDERLPEKVELCIYRVAQEALTNIIKHAEASRISIKLTKGYPDVILIIEDNGKGFDTSAELGLRDKLGLAGMRERVSSIGGTLSIRSSPGKGTRIRATFPVGDENE